MADRESRGFTVEEIFTGMHASGYGHLDDGRSFAFYMRRGQMIVEVYRPSFAGPVPQYDDIVASAVRSVARIDIHDVRSVVAVVRDTVAAARPIKRAGSRLQNSQTRKSAREALTHS